MKNEQEKAEYIKTPRGSFKYAFDTLEDAREAGFSVWFQHNDELIVGNGTTAFAVRAKVQ